jgi:RNA polymerase sigma factor (sigma-70 family)
MPLTTTTNAEALLQRLDRVRVLARRLVRDGAEADDLVQDAVATALGRRAVVNGNPVDWLGVTLRNLARDRARTAYRRAGREASAAPREALADTTLAVENAERQRDIVAEVLALEEPQRSVILLSFFEELSLREVAARTGASLEAVKKQRQRGLERLRHRLAARYGDRTAWAVALLPLAGKGVLAGSRVSALGVGSLCVAVVLATIGFWRFGGGDASTAARVIAPSTEKEELALLPVVLQRVDAAPPAQATSAQKTLAQESPPKPEDARAVATPPADIPQGRASTPHPLPELVRVEGGPTRIGSTQAEVEEILGRTPAYTRILDAQRPDHVVEVPTFWIGRYEVTNAEYHTFVVATGHQPPIHWANVETMQAAAAEFARAQDAAHATANAAGGTYERRRWAADPAPNPRDKWWAEHWREAGFAIPEGFKRHPVIYVAYADAEAFCAWHGLRLPTEFEFQRAARQHMEHTYPWGNEWKDGKYANTTELRRSKPMAVGSFPEGASALGVLDLAGNVWEWTSSPYVAYPGFQQGTYRVRVDGTLDSVAPQWNPNHRVVVGGAYEVDRIAARIATRRGTDPAQFTSGMGFRVATSAP